jgi:predicted transcriptional regulator
MPLHNETEGASNHLKDRRNKLQQIVDVIEECQKKPLLKSHIMGKATLGWAATKELIIKMVEIGLLETIETRKHIYYKPTQKGTYILLKIREIEAMIDPSKPQPLGSNRP